MSISTSSRAFAYIRCSTEEQADSGLGLEAQRRRILGYCQMRGLELGSIFEDPGVSGAKPLAARPGGERLVAAIEKGSIVVMLKLDRGFRSAVDCLQTVEAWEKKHISLHIVDLGGNAVDTTSAAGKFMLTVLAGAAEMERNVTCERTQAAMNVKRSRSERISRHIPYGFDLSPDGKQLTENAAEQAVIAEMRLGRANGMGIRKLAADLNRRGVPTKLGCGVWKTSSVQGILARVERLERSAA